VSLEARLIRRIARLGPMSVADYMAECLHDPQDGYYATRDPFGATGDFVTAPEISQMFGELLGLWLAQVWMDQGRPEGVLAELGPGRGTLMADALRATRGVDGFHDALRLHLVEASPVLRDRQAEVLGAHQPVFRDSVADLPEAPLFLLANEFFDALPIRQFQMNDAGDWQERQVGLADGQLIWGLAPPAPLAARKGFEPGMIVETCAPGEALAQEIGRRVATHGGAALIVDYGDAESRGDTLQALRAHTYADPLQDPGQADLTAHVAFGPLARAAEPAIASALVPQGVFLERLGITARAQALARNLSGAALEAHVSAHRRLTHPEEMGNLFKVMSLLPPHSPPPPALEPLS
jgi:SAM-dependent MidA family methyltransferase